MVDDSALFMSSSSSSSSSNQNCTTTTLRRSRSDISYAELLREERKARRQGCSGGGGRTFPPPLCSMARTSYANCPNQVPWVQLQTIRSNGRIVLQEVNKIDNQMSMQPIRTEGRLVLNLVVRRGDENSRPRLLTTSKIVKKKEEEQQVQPAQIINHSNPPPPPPPPAAPLPLVTAVPIKPMTSKISSSEITEEINNVKIQAKEQVVECCNPPRVVQLERLHAIICSVAQPHCNWQCRCIGSSEEDIHKNQQNHPQHHHRTVWEWEHHNLRCVTT